MDVRIDRLRLIVPRLGDSTKNLGNMKSHNVMGDKRRDGNVLHVNWGGEVFKGLRVVVHVSCPSRNIGIRVHQYQF